MTVSYNGFVVDQRTASGTVIGSTTPVTLTVNDGMGGSESCAFNVLLNDGILPTISCPAVQQLVADPSTGQAVLIDFSSMAIVGDNCDPAPLVTQNPPPGTSIGGTTPVTLTVTDASANSDDCMFDVQVVMPTADLGIRVTDGSCFVLPGDSVTYAVVMENYGPSDAPVVLVTDVDVVPPDLDVFTWICVPFGAAACGSASGTGDLDDMPSLPAGDGVFYVVSGAVSSWASGYLVYSVDAAHASFAVDPVPDNDSDSDASATELPIFCGAFEDGTTDGLSSVIP